MTRAHLQARLRQHGSVAETARALGVHPMTVRRHAARHGLAVARPYRWRGAAGDGRCPRCAFRPCDPRQYRCGPCRRPVPVLGWVDGIDGLTAVGAYEVP